MQRFGSWGRCGPRLALHLTIATAAAVLVAGQAAAAGVVVKPANLHNPYFPDRAPDAAPSAGDGYTLGDAPPRQFGLVGDTLSIPFSLVADGATRLSLEASLVANGRTLASTGGSAPVKMRLLRARDVTVEGNSNASCSCAAGQLPVKGDGRGEMLCVPASSANESRTPDACPNDQERGKLRSTFVRPAPFSIKDPLEPLAGASFDAAARSTELVVVELPVDASLPKAELTLKLVAKTADGTEGSAQVPVRVLNLALDAFPRMDLSYWLSEDPRDLVERPAGTRLNEAWGGAWWSDEHWAHIETAARVQAAAGVTNTLVPLFTRNLWGIAATPLVGVRCITGSDAVPTDATGGDGPSPFDGEVGRWQYAFDFSRFERWIDIFQRAGFRRFEGAHLFANAGGIPQVLECDLYRNASDDQPYRKAFRFMPRVANDGLPGLKRARLALYRERFLPAFLKALGAEVRKTGIQDRYLQHVIDENDSSEEAIRAYADGVRLVREFLPRTPTTDAINKYSAPEYSSLTDVPVFHMILLYNDQGRLPGIRDKLVQQFGNRKKYFYNTALRAGGPNRFLDTNPMDSRAHGWLMLETGFDGFLYWASNQYRYPIAKDMSRLRRPDDWSPYRYSLGPLPGGLLEPAYGAGANWVLYPTANGLIGSLRALRLRDGMLDHWLFAKAQDKCSKERDDTCLNRLRELRRRITANPDVMADFSRHPADYDRAREVLVEVLAR